MTGLRARRLNDQQWTLELDLEPFAHSVPRMHRPSSIGRGVTFLNKYLSTRLFVQQVRQRPAAARALSPQHTG